MLRRVEDVCDQGKRSRPLRVIICRLSRVLVGDRASTPLAMSVAKRGEGVERGCAGRGYRREELRAARWRLSSPADPRALSAICAKRCARSEQRAPRAACGVGVCARLRNGPRVPVGASPRCTRSTWCWNDSDVARRARRRAAARSDRPGPWWRRFNDVPARRLVRSRSELSAHLDGRQDARAARPGAGEHHTEAVPRPRRVARRSARAALRGARRRATYVTRGLSRPSLPEDASIQHERRQEPAAATAIISKVHRDACPAREARYASRPSAR